MDIKKLSNEELDGMRTKLLGEVEATRAKLKVVTAEINSRNAEQKLKKVIDSLTPAERESLHQTLSAKGIDSAEKFGKLG